MPPKRANQKPKTNGAVREPRTAPSRDAAAANAAAQQEAAVDDDLPVTRRGTRRGAVPQPVRGGGGGPSQGEGNPTPEDTPMDVDEPPAPRRSARQAGAQAAAAVDATGSLARRRDAKSSTHAPSTAEAIDKNGLEDDAMDVDPPAPTKKSKSKGGAKASKGKAKAMASEPAAASQERATEGLQGTAMDVDNDAPSSQGKAARSKEGGNRAGPPSASPHPSSHPASGGPSSAGGPSRRSASVSRATVGNNARRQNLAYVDIPRPPAHATSVRSLAPVASPTSPTPSGPPSPSPSDNSSDGDPSPDFEDPGNAGDGQGVDELSDEGSGHSTPTRPPKKRRAPSPGSPITRRQSKRSRNGAERSPRKPPQVQAMSPAGGSEAAAEDLFADEVDVPMASPENSESGDDGSNASARGRTKKGGKGGKSKKAKKAKKGGKKGKGKAKAKKARKGKGKERADESSDEEEGGEEDDGSGGSGSSDDSSSSSDSDDSNRPRYTAKEKAKGRAPAPSDDEGNAAGPSGTVRADKGKGKAPALDEAQPSTSPGVFNAGDYLPDDAELPPMDDLFSFVPQDDPNAPGPSTRRATNRTRPPADDAPAYAPGRLPDQARTRAEEQGVKYILELQAIAQEYNKPLDVVFRLAGWMHSDSAHARRWQRANVFRRYWASTTPVDPEVSSEERRAQMDAAYRSKMAELGENPTTDQLMDHFKKEYDYCVEMDRELIENASSRQRQRQIDSLAQQFSRLALAANLNNGVAVVGYIVDLHGRAHTGMFGGGAVYDELLRRYSGNFTRGLEDVSTMLRACDLRLRGLQEDGEPNAAALEDPIEGWFPERDWSLDPNQNRSDEYLRILYELLRWDLGAIYRMANERLSSRHTAKDPRQFPRAIWSDIAYRLGICLVNWPEALRRNMPKKGLKRKPAGRTWSALVAGMVNHRRRAEAESNRRNLEGEEALHFLHGLGVPVLSPLPRDYALLPHHKLSRNPVVQSPRPPQSIEPRLRRPTSFLTWRDSARYLKDRENDTDSRIKWQSYWGPERNDGLVRDGDNSDSDARASTEGVSIKNIRNPAANSFNNWWAPWEQVESVSRRPSRLFQLQMSEDEEEENGIWEDVEDEESEEDEERPSAAQKDAALRRLKAARDANRRTSSAVAGSSKVSKASSASTGAGPSKGKSSKDKSSKDKSSKDKSSKGGSKRK